MLNTSSACRRLPVQPTIVGEQDANTITVRATRQRGRDHRADHRGQRQPARRGGHRRPDPRGQPRARQAVRPRPGAATRSPAVFSPGDATRRHADDGATLAPTRRSTLNTITRGISTADFYLSVPSAVVRFLETDSETQADRQAAAARRRRAEDHAEPRRRDSRCRRPTFTPVAPGRRRLQPADLVQLPAGRRQRRDHAARDVRGRHHARAACVENSTLGAGHERSPARTCRRSARARSRRRLRLRDGESNLLAGLLREDERRVAARASRACCGCPILKQLFAGNDNAIGQTDIVMLLTPRIVRTHELTQQDVNPIYIGTQQNLGLGGPPPLIAAPAAGAEPAAPAPPARRAGQPTPMPRDGTLPQPGIAARAPAPPPDAAAAADAGAAAAAAARARADDAAEPTPPVGPGRGQAPCELLVTPPGPEFRVGGGPYTVPISVTGASRLSTLSLTVTYNPAVLRVRACRRAASCAGRRAGDASPSRSSRGRPHRHRHRPRQAMRPASPARGCSPRCSSTRWRRPGQPHGHRHGDRARRGAAAAAVRARAGGDGASGRDAHATPDDAPTATASSAATRSSSCSSSTASCSVLASAVMPLARSPRSGSARPSCAATLREMRTAIDSSRTPSIRARFRPPSSSRAARAIRRTSRRWSRASGGRHDASGRKLKFLRRVPIDPMTGEPSGGMRAYQDKPDSTIVGRAERVRRVHEERRHGARRHEVQGLVDDGCMATPDRPDAIDARLHAHRADDRDVADRRSWRGSA